MRAPSQSTLALGITGLVKSEEFGGTSLFAFLFKAVVLLPCLVVVAITLQQGVARSLLA